MGTPNTAAPHTLLIRLISAVRGTHSKPAPRVLLLCVQAELSPLRHGCDL